MFEVESKVCHGREGHPPLTVPPLKVAAVSLLVSLTVFFFYFLLYFFSSLFI